MNATDQIKKDITMCYELEINPRDVMFFRDGRPIGASAEGSGAVWPLPSTFYSAMMSALSIAFSAEISEWEGKHNKTSQDKETARFNFGGLKTWGPFPKDYRGDIYLPTPADLLVSDAQDNIAAGVISPVNNIGFSNLPKPLKYSVASTQKPSKKELGAWISVEQFVKYLKGENKGLETKPGAELFSSESRPGVAINPETGANEEGAFYSAEYMRLKDGVSMAAFAECEAKKFNKSSGKDVLSQLFSDRSHNGIIFGGQRGVAWLENKRNKSASSPINISPSIGKSRRVKWVLLSPAYFEQGWIPGWVKDGQVMLSEKVERGSMTRQEWRDQIKKASTIEAELVAARIPKALVASGWKLDKDSDNAGGEAKATRLYIPAGAVYYFECTSEEEAQKLVTTLHGQTKSDNLGEKGFGLGVCASWELTEI